MIVFRALLIGWVIAFPFANQAAELKRDIPKAAWESVFFKPINQLTAKAGWKPLRESSLPAQSLDVRIWIGFGLAPLECYSLRRDGSRWTGHYVVDIRDQTNSVLVRDITPKSGWTEVWDRLVQLDLLSLPDSSTLHGQKVLLDGVGCVVEINRDGQYRTYEYSNPQYQKWPEAKKLNHIIRTLRDEFDTIRGLQTPEVKPNRNPTSPPAAFGGEGVKKTPRCAPG